MNITFLVIAGLALHVSSQVTNTTLEKMNGVLVEVEDRCKPEVKASCKTGYCCVKAIISYMPGYKGRRAAYRLACRQLRKWGELCIPEDRAHICPCMDGYFCQLVKDSDYGHCFRKS